MLKKIPMRLRLTALTILLLTACCVGLTIMLNFSANTMADVIEATAVVPSQRVEGDKTMQELPPAQGMEALTTTVSYSPARRLFLRQSIIGMVLVVAIGGGLTYYISGKALKPLQVLSGQMQNRTVHNLSEKLPVPESRDEISQLTVSFNEMSEKLEEAFAMQKRFSQSAAHELRTPLTVLKTKVDVFRKKSGHTADEYDKLLAVIEAHTNRLAALVKNLLELTNMDAVSCDDSVELKAMLCDIKDELSGAATEKNISVTLLGDEMEIIGNYNLLHRAFYNLVENAIRYNKDGGGVTVTLGTANQRTSIAVSDTGIGIACDARELVFEPFYRVDKSRSRKAGGAGLGLATAKTIVQKHGGEINVKSDENGTTFEVIL